MSQMIFDNFLFSSRSKWENVGLTLFLPHAYEGQGPEHSSARLTIQLAAELVELSTYLVQVIISHLFIHSSWFRF